MKIPNHLGLALLVLAAFGENRRLPAQTPAADKRPNITGKKVN